MNGRPIILGILAFALILAGCVEQSGNGNASPTPGGSAYSGRAVVAMTDAAADMGAVTSVRMRVDEVKVHSASQGWVTVDSTPKTYDLLQLKSEASTALLADAQLREDTYDQIDLDISSVTVVDAEGEHQAKLPSNSFKVIGEVVVKANSTATATFDFIADASVHVTGNGDYVVAPVAQVETRQNAQVQAQSNNRVAISGGSVKTNARIGMDVNGNVGVGLKIPADAVLNIGAGGVIGIGGLSGAGQGNVLVGITDAAADMGAVTSVKVTIESVKVHNEAQGWIDVSSTAATYDLLQLKAEGATALLANATLDAGNYDQVRLDISKVVVTDAEGDHAAKLPSGELKVFTDVVVDANSTASATFDFIANESLHVTGNGMYILAPVVQVESRANAMVESQANNRIRVTGGMVKTNIKVGMDVDGNVGVGLGIPLSANVTIGSDGKIGLGNALGARVGVGVNAGYN